jgi:aryl-alcohol dehydrogenase-like predicted oxidoreductase
MTFGGSGAAGPWAAIGGLAQDDVNSLLKCALDAGINFIDTADVYSAGQSEVSLERGLKALGVMRSDVVIATKFHGRVGPGPNDVGASRGHIMDAVSRSLERLDLDYIDLYQIHGQDPVTPIEETLRALDDLISQGLVRYAGCSNWQAWKLMQALAFSAATSRARFETLQAYYSIAGRDLERELAPLLIDQKVGLLVWSPLAGGLLSGKFSRDGGPKDARRTGFDFPPVDRDRAWRCIDAMRSIAESHGSSVPRVALAWLLSKPFVSSVIVGAKTLTQLQDNVGAVDLKLSPEAIASLDAVSALPQEYPGWMLEFQRSARMPKSS